ncbi:CDP-diacylglycerol--glycerol-3-phosphate 3-phosphatidyltransferase [Petrotoga sp. 9PW.55.5.1]|uniref:CDP-diacylglycerol--glycerol-3-phosphate 3-phosphatidyltransferase n=1 Tax=Petrotoga sp. 9PW.55.5.1 TaxID=1308979 RepID=UPI000DC398BE|nr:CDP-diacylglycerol--glycerol-3-phosphate 3-phosphatidyltransferase [Petrotoga sp. 9PW.55.5.1]RAO98834.1 CDP-diacylglycerol--glycerol-3-phosphate 3-phosphatidyltransferase [Petrotoga sp. 9PW.55.5.1]
MNLPNLLSFSRIILAIPIFILTIFGEPIYTTALILFIIASLTDWLDGLVARRTGQVTDLGKFFDQISDKILINTVFIAMLGAGILPAWFVAVIVSRDTYVSGLRMVAASKSVVVPADMSGKIKTVLQILLIIVIYLNLWMVLVTFLLYLTVIISLLSAFNYTIKNIKQIN